MPDVPNVTDLPVKPSALKRWSKRAVVAAVAAAAVALIAAKVQSSDEDTVNDSTKA